MNAYRNVVVRAIGTYLQKYRKAAPPALLAAINRLYSHLTTSTRTSTKQFLRQVIYNIKRVIVTANAEIDTLIDTLRQCRLYNLKLPKAPSKEWFRTGKDDPRKQLCQVDNMDTISAMRDSLRQMQIDLIQCMDPNGILSNMLKTYQLTPELQQLQTTCRKLRHSRLLRTGEVLNNCPYFRVRISLFIRLEKHPWLRVKIQSPLDTIDLSKIEYGGYRNVVAPDERKWTIPARGKFTVTIYYFEFDKPSKIMSLSYDWVKKTTMTAIRLIIDENEKLQLKMR